MTTMITSSTSGPHLGLKALLQALHDPRVGSRDLFAGQGTVIGLVVQAKGQAAPAGAQLRPLVFALHRDLPQRVTATLPDYLHEIVAQDPTRYHHCQVPPHAREPGQRPRLRYRWIGLRKPVEDDLGRDHP